MDNIAAFYLDARTIHRKLGFTYSDVMGFSKTEWEKCHNYIQWLFPTVQPSQFNPDAPIPFKGTLSLFDEFPILRERMIYAHGRFRNFLFSRKTLPWVKPGNHNFLRITRMLDSANFFGLDAAKEMDVIWIKDHLLSNPKYNTIIQDSLLFWKKAAGNLITPWD